MNKQEDDVVFWKKRLLESYFLSYHNDIKKCTCCECNGKFECEFAYDPYNSDGDCLMDK